MFKLGIQVRFKVGDVVPMAKFQLMAVVVHSYSVDPQNVNTGVANPVNTAPAATPTPTINPVPAIDTSVLRLILGKSGHNSRIEELWSKGRHA